MTGLAGGFAIAQAPAAPTVPSAVRILVVEVQYEGPRPAYYLRAPAQRDGGGHPHRARHCRQDGPPTARAVPRAPIGRAPGVTTGAATAGAVGTSGQGGSGSGPSASGATGSGVAGRFGTSEFPGPGAGRAEPGTSPGGAANGATAVTASALPIAGTFNTLVEPPSGYGSSRVVPRGPFYIPAGQTQSLRLKGDALARSAMRVEVGYGADPVRTVQQPFKVCGRS